MPRRSLLALLTLFAVQGAPAQESGGFDLQAYEQFLASHTDLATAQLQAMYPAGAFKAKVYSSCTQPEYLDSINYFYALTPDEKTLLTTNGFLVTSRLSQPTMLTALADIYHHDLPVFISTDAILQALHYSYDLILQDIEKSILEPDLRALLKSLRSQLPALEAKYAVDPRMSDMLHDLDIYLTIPMFFLDNTTSPYFPDNDSTFWQLIAKIGAEKFDTTVLFGAPRWMDFSQFTVRGHYNTADSSRAHYFRAMMWLGRTEIYLRAPHGTVPPATDANIQRQAIDAVLVQEAATGANAFPTLAAMDSIITFMVGQSDNVTLPNLSTLMEDVGVTSASDLLDTARFNAFQDSLVKEPFAFQRILSQILGSNPMTPDQVEPASSFLLLGQRFIIDSYITGSVVYDRILYQGQKILRFLPSPQDVLFSLGNSASAQLLQPELDQYHYASNLAALRYLVDSYGEDFWKSSLFNCWLWTLRSLNPPQDRSPLPEFMQTAAWWQQKMNTQLASWAQLRHDDLLYAKQSYTAMLICSYPAGYVEPYPEFFIRLGEFAHLAGTRMGNLSVGNSIGGYFQGLEYTAAILDTIAEKELSGAALTDYEDAFLQATLEITGSCFGDFFSGWYPRLYYGSAISTEEAPKTDFVVADVHTDPNHGWILHVGVAPVDLAIVNVAIPGGRCRAFVGPVQSYYECITDSFHRMTDEEWTVMYGSPPSMRPDWVNIYLANAQGNMRGAGPSLATGIADEPIKGRPAAFALYQNYPNPFNPATSIPFTVPGSVGMQKAVLEIFDVGGRLVATLVNGQLSPGNYLIRWDGRTRSGGYAATGVYFYRLQAGGMTQTKKMVLLR